VNIVRAGLLLVLAIIGGHLGSYLGGLYTSPQFFHRDISTYLGRYIGPDLAIRATVYGFVAVGMLFGVMAYTKAIAYISHLADNLREMPANDKLALFFGAFMGLLLTFFLHPFLNQITEPLVRTSVTISLTLVLLYLTTQGAMSMREELRKLLTPYGSVAQDDRPAFQRAKILDTNIIIDGRIADICRTGFIDGTIYVPGFVLDELQTMADSSDSLKRARGRRGLDILNAMQKEFSLIVRSYDHLISGEEREPVDTKLVRLAKATDGTIVTNDFNLNKVAELQGVTVLNVNELANALKPVVLPGEELTVHVIKEGKEPGQGIAYLDDGTMVVVENARRHVGETVTVVVGSVLQTVAGKMIFGNIRDHHEEEEELMDRNLRSYYRGQRRGPRY
jgi:uncharacterized protein YacL